MSYMPSPDTIITLTPLNGGVSGGSITITEISADVIFGLNIPGPLDSFTINFPISSRVGQDIMISSNQDITSLVMNNVEYGELDSFIGGSCINYIRKEDGNFYRVGI